MKQQSFLVLATMLLSATATEPTSALQMDIVITTNGKASTPSNAAEVSNADTPVQDGFLTPTMAFRICIGYRRLRGEN